MQRIIEFFVRQSLFGNLLSIAVIGLGILSGFLIKREVFPNVNFDVITVVTPFPGASPSEVEKLVTNPIEQDLKEVDGVKRLLSASIENRSGIVLFLDSDQTTEEQAKQDVQDVIDSLEELPEGTKEPLVTAVKSKQQPIIEVAIAGDIPEMDLRNIAKKLEAELEKVPGVAKVVHRGLRDVEVRVETDVKKLAHYRLSLDDVVAALKRQNLSIPGGVVESSGDQVPEKLVRTVGDFTTPEEIKKTVIRANELGEPLRVGDVAEVFYDLEKSSVVTRTNGLPSLSLTVLKKEKADAIDLVDAVKARMTELKPQLDSRLGVSFINDFSQYIRRRLGILTGNLGIGLAMVLLMLPLLIPFRFSLLIALGEPFAFLGTIMVLYYTGNSINLISMMGLIIVSGILVDDSIVVTENAVSMVEKGADPYTAAVKGTMQIIGPVTASVLTTTVAFLPMAFMSGIFGKFIAQIPLAVVTALGVSLFETFFILPAHIAHWIKPRTEKQKMQDEKTGFWARVTGTTRSWWDTSVVPFYMRWLKVSVEKRYWVAGLLLVLFVGTIGLAAKGMRFILFPPEGVEVFFIRTQAPTATSLEKHAQLLKPIEDILAKLPKQEVENFTTTVGLVQQDPNDPNTKRGPEYAQIAVYLTPERSRDRIASEIIDALRPEVTATPGFTKITFNRLNPGPPTGKPVSLGVRAKDYDEILPAVAELKKILTDIKGVTDINDSYAMGKEELRINVNSREAASSGLSVASVGNTVRAAYEGIVATSIRELDEEIDVRVSLPKADRTRASSLDELLIPNATGQLVRLSSVAKVTKTQGLLAYEHEAHQREVKVTAEVDTKEISAVVANNKVREFLPELRKKFPGVGIDFGGEDEDTAESMASLLRAFVIALIGIFLILVMTFKSILQPMVVLITVPLGIIAVIWAFFLHGMPLSFMGMLGIIALSGVIVNNAIVFVDFVNQARTEGVDRFASIYQAAERRLRPIFLTTVTTVIGILPTAYGLGGLDKFVVPIAMALGWGLGFGSILTAFVFPAALAILDDLAAWGKRFRPRTQP